MLIKWFLLFLPLAIGLGNTCVVRRQNAGGHNAGGQIADENCMVGQNAGLFWVG